MGTRGMQRVMNDFAQECMHSAACTLQHHACIVLHASWQPLSHRPPGAVDGTTHEVAPAIGFSMHCKGQELGGWV